MTSQTETQKWGQRALLAGALIGLAMAALTAVPLQEAALSHDGAIARINQTHIDRTAFANAYQALLSDKTKTPTMADKKMALERLVEEELLVQRGLEIGLLEGDVSVRKAMAGSVIAFVLAQNNQSEISQAELTAYYDENRARFSPASRLQIERIFVRHDPDAPHETEPRLNQIRAALRDGQAFGDIARRLGDPLLPRLPQTLLPVAKMTDYLGPDLTQAASRLPQGSISDAMATAQGWQFLHIIVNEPSQDRDFDAIADLLKTSLQRDRDDQALREYIDWLRQRADIYLAEDAPQ